MDTFAHLHDLPSQKLSALFLKELHNVMKEEYVWPHYDMAKIGDQQDKATMLSTEASIFMLIPKSNFLCASND